MDKIMLYQEKSGIPFPLCFVTISISQVGADIVGECFVLVDNGKEYFNGERIVLPADSNDELQVEAMCQRAQRLLIRMQAAASRRGGKSAPADLQSPALERVPVEGLSGLWQAGRFQAHIKWVGQKSASPRLRGLIADLAGGAR